MLSIKFDFHCLYFVRIGYIPIYYHVHKTFVTVKKRISENIIGPTIRIALVGYAKYYNFTMSLNYNNLANVVNCINYIHS